MGRSLVLVSIVATFAVAGRAHAGAQTLSLARVLDAVRSNNPAIHAAEARAVAAAQVPARAGAYDDPVVSWEAWNVPESTRIDHADNNIVRLSQKIPFPGKRTLAADMARRDADAIQHDASAVALDAVTVAKRAYADLWRADRARVVYGRALVLGERLARLVAQRYATGGVPQADVVRADVEVSHTVGDLRTSELAADEARAALAAVVSAPSSDVAGTPEDPPPARLPGTSGDLVERALAARPEVGARDATVAREQSGLRLAEKGYLPDFEVSVGRFVNHDAPDGFGAMASMTIPLAWKSKYDAGVAEANARIVGATAERRVVTDGIRRDVEQAYARARSAQVMHELFGDTHIPHAEQALRVTEAAYVAGETDLTALLETARNVERVHLEHLDATAAFERAYADLERAVGVDLPRPARKGAHHD
jgi:outer membrane protein, heavy metal efflux system